MEYKFRELELIKELEEYVNKTYDQHYATDKYQATDIIIDSGHGTGFCLGNVIKYAKRYGRKGSDSEARKDLMKILHYALIQLYIHDEQVKPEAPKEKPRTTTPEEWAELYGRIQFPFFQNAKKKKMPPPTSNFDLDHAPTRDPDKYDVVRAEVPRLDDSLSSPCPRLNDATPAEWDAVAKGKKNG